MHILITGADRPLGKLAAGRFSASHTLRLTGQAASLDGPANSEYVQADLRDPEQAKPLVAGIDAILHLDPYDPAPVSGSTAEQERLDIAGRGTYVLFLEGREAGVSRFVIAGNLSAFERYPARYVIDEQFQPQPAADAESLAPMLAELTAREFAREGGVRCACLRFGALGDSGTNVDEALEAIEEALAREFEERDRSWDLKHVTSGQHIAKGTDDVAVAGGDSGRLEKGKLCIFGAGGPVGTSATRALQNDYTLRLTDLRAVEEIEEQSKYAPKPEPPEPPHEWCQVDITNYDQVLAAAQGMDSLINCSVLRDDLVPAFRVNLVGAYNVMKAAVECGIQRVIHTGPRHIGLNHDADYYFDFDIPDEAPLHPGTNLYAISKYLGGQVVRVFAEQHNLEVITFLYCNFRISHAGDAEDGSGVTCFATSWEDTGAAFPCALRAPAPPNPYEVFDIVASLPHGKFSNAKAKRLLGWTPKHNFERLYTRPNK